MTVTKETAILAKEKGLKKDSFLNRTVVHSLYGEEYLLTPTQSELWQWLIDEHKLFVKLNTVGDKDSGTYPMFEYAVVDLRDYMSSVNNTLDKLCLTFEETIGRAFKTNTEAFEKGLQEALKQL